MVVQAQVSKAAGGVSSESYVTAPGFPMDVLSQCTPSGQLRVSPGRYCYNCGLPLGYYGDRRGVCGRRTFFVARQRVLIRTSMLSYARRSRLENIVCNFPDVLDIVLEFIVGSYSVSMRLRARCVRWQLFDALCLPLSQLGNGYWPWEARVRCLVAAFEGPSV